MAKNTNKTKVITGANTRLSYFHGGSLFHQRQSRKYSIRTLFQKDDTETITQSMCH